MITCCKDCKKRYLGCHDRCEQYQKEKTDLKKEKEYNKQTRGRPLSNNDFDRANDYRFEHKGHRKH